ncbi:MAG: amidohydrolase [Deltaproteobacteria bacterium]|nr:amidohydrolase [Deltaproteobacteria bacterium]NND29653.1 amidohydrolase family protein [Myxococcales bacterium]MBT8463882.1 amidohydrolase [Deltaproteobacteria bacterium]NNK09659.1 amidohydrolase family protein [Myxococcales bacterium]NNK43343.1 amidohydrolase family protein [Myxococcales bacterium]
MSYLTSRLPRRKFLKYAGGASATAVVPACAGSSAAPCDPSKDDCGEPNPPSAQVPLGTTLDTHHHVVPADYVDRLTNIGVDAGAGIPFPTWDPEMSLSVMDRQGIDAAVLSLSSPGTYFGDEAFATSLARDMNEYSATMVGDNPKRFGLFATVPQPLGDATAAEAVYALDTLGADGLMLLGASRHARIR